MKLPVLLLFLCLSLIGCDSRQSLPVFAVTGEQERSVDLQVDSEEAGRYLLQEPVVVTGVDRAFHLRYRGGGSGSTVRIFGEGDREIAAKILPAATEAVVYVPLRRGQIVGGFKLDIPAAGRVELLEAGIDEAVSGFRNTGSLLTVGTAVRNLKHDGRAVRLSLEAPEDWQIAVALETSPAFDYADFRIRESLANAAGGTNLSGPSPAAGSAATVPEPAKGKANRRTSVLLRLQSGESSATFRHSALPGEHTLFLYQGMVSFIPETLIVEPVEGLSLIHI